LVFSLLTWCILGGLVYGVVGYFSPESQPLVTEVINQSQMPSVPNNPAPAPPQPQPVVPPKDTGATLSAAAQEAAKSVSDLAAPKPMAPVTVTPPTQSWLVIVESIPKSARQEAEQALTRHKKRGVELELFDTDAYPLLKSGMWTLAKGPFETKAEAEAAAALIKSKVKDFMIRRGL
jgi:hypothetical protein